jgi:hypothetical protein
MSINIEIDCAPGSTRPGNYFKQIITIISNNELEYISTFGKKLLNNPIEPVSKRFGNWEWVIPLTEEEIRFSKEIHDIFQKNLTDLYNSGAIRYASW